MVGVFFTIVMFGDIQGVGGPQKPRGTQIDVWGFFSKMDEISTLCFFSRSTGYFRYPNQKVHQVLQL